MNNLNIPILFLIFNRLDTTVQVFAKIREAVPSKLYIASDGPRDNRKGEDEKVSSVREYVLKSIDWDCEVKTLFREENLGCGKAVSQSITWFFENEEMGIILEDDCLPSASFFPYCKELLEKYKDDTRIYHIAGFNPLTLTKTPYSYYFTRIQHCWGWATWRRVWSLYNFDITDLNDFISQNKIQNLFRQKTVQDYWINIFRDMQDHKIDTWDYQWTYTIFKNSGLCINPSKNLITNIGFNCDATHTLDTNSVFNNQKRYEIDIIKHPQSLQIKTSLINKINKVVFRINKLKPIKTRIKFLIKRLLNIS